MWSDSPQLAAPPSEVSSCIKTFPLEIEQITQHIQSLMNSTRDFYIFKDVAIDPAKSIPSYMMKEHCDHCAPFSMNKKIRPDS